MFSTRKIVVFYLIFSSIIILLLLYVRQSLKEEYLVNKTQEIEHLFTVDTFERNITETGETECTFTEGMPNSMLMTCTFLKSPGDPLETITGSWQKGFF